MPREVTFYLCAKCRVPLFTNEHTNSHEEDYGTCTSHFFDTLPEWAPENGDDEGKINCPKCEARLGSYKWSGESCPCGEFICPFIHIHRRRVDAKKLIVK